ncbi:MAG TPA: hypothetical protein VFB06_29450 [Streptosporangiaceae bacterium]|nr:hypothetical protein [Streptosporangiaceae bacterium]
MGWSPRLNTVCAACGRPRELFGHVCVNPRRKGHGVRLRMSWGTCPKCRRKYTGTPASHVCAPRSDFKKRKKAFEAEQAKREREKNRKARPKHDYLECSDAECKRPTCVAYKTGREQGDLEGYDRGWQQGYNRGYPDGQAACPRDHK